MIHLRAYSFDYKASFIQQKTVAQNTATPTINIVETCNQLKVALAHVLDQQGEVKLVQVPIDRLVDNVHRLPNMDMAADVLRFIFYPFGTRALEHGSQVY
ncbi:unnamed protein product [Rotaria magnacalcarata]|uniref:Uncharacterized protein n=2 Tax=Rotaria magnacalcarata TaxID=392030 RepID=A0A815V7J4_9BILA|nr:unnamed protein product [Rotaria magnacalcarata]CAF1578426.1 unnamed protein product [Rotaria magnacalcarata]CAF2061045.1 unnamed protein product [Rotaria magnacalcarata]